jgi:hypothetical protein
MFYQSIDEIMNNNNIREFHYCFEIVYLFSLIFGYIKQIFFLFHSK